MESLMRQRYVVLDVLIAASGRADRSSVWVKRSCRAIEVLLP